MKKTHNKWWALLALLLAGAGGWYWYQGKDTVVEAEPLLATVRIGSIENTISASGSLKPRNFVDVGAQVSGLLQKLHVEVGDVVEEGQLLAEIDARVQAERVNASRASLEGQRAQLDARNSSLELARINVDRQERLRAANATSQQEYDTAINNLATAEASLVQLQKQIEQSEASLKTEETQLEFTKIYAPVAGTVTSIAMNEGRTLNAAQQAPIILTIADLGTMTVETQISEADVSKIKPGMEVYFTTLGNGTRRWHSSLRQILPTPVVSNNVVLYTGLFDIENSDGILLPEMTTQVYFISSAVDDVLIVPMGALSFIDDPGNASARADTVTSMAADVASPGSPVAQGPTPQVPEVSREPARQVRVSGAPPPGGVLGRGFGSARLTQPGERSLARVTVMHADGTREPREVVIGLTSRVNAEVVSGLKVGEEVVAGIAQSLSVQPTAGNNNSNFRPRMIRF